MTLDKNQTFEDYVKDHLDEFFLTGKNDYIMQVCIADKEQSFHNPFEDADYTVKPGDIILKGTVGEMLTTSLEKALKTYKMPDGSPLTEEYLNQHKGNFVDVKSEGARNTNFALRVPKEISFIVPTSWAELTINKPGIDNGQGGMLMCRPDKFGRPDLSDVWVVNGKIFETTYDKTNDPTRDWPWATENTKENTRFTSLQTSDPNTIRIKDNKRGEISELRFELHSYLEPVPEKDKVTVTMYDKDGSWASRNFNVEDIENNTKKVGESGSYLASGSDKNFFEEFGDPSGLFRELYPDLLKIMKERREAQHFGKEMPYKIHPEIVDKIDSMVYGFQFIEQEIPTNNLMFREANNGTSLAVDGKFAVLFSPEKKIVDAVIGDHAKKLKNEILSTSRISWVSTGGHYDPRSLVVNPFYRSGQNWLNYIKKVCGSKLLECIYGEKEAKKIRKNKGKGKEIKQNLKEIKKGFKEIKKGKSPITFDHDRL